MSLLKPALLLFGATFSIIVSYSQDKLYFASNTNQGNVRDVTSAAVTYIPLQNSKPVNVETKKILLVFNKQGDYLLPSHMDFSRELSRQLIDKFLTRKAATSLTDRIFTRDKKMIPGIFVSEDKNFVYYTTNGQAARVEKDKVVAIIFKDGHHLIYKNASEAAEALWSIQQNSQNAITEINTDQNNSPQVKTEHNGDKPVLKKDSINHPLVASIESITVDSTKPLIFEDLAPTISKDEFVKKAEHKTTQFGNYIKILCDKSKEAYEHNNAIEQALTLFVNEQAIVETSSTHRADVTRKTIKQYLISLKMLSYDKIELTWTSVHYVSDVKLGPDGNYYGTVTFEQIFRGYEDGKIVYQDITRKNATVVLKTYDKNIDGTTQKTWDVLLADIGVKSTKGIKPTE